MIGDHVFFTTGLNFLYVSKTVSKEAKSFFFSQNLFNFAWCGGSWTPRIFERIGLDSVSQMEHVMVQFPYTQGEPMSSGFVDGSFQTLKLVQKHSTNLKILTTSFSLAQGLDQRLRPEESSEDDIRKHLEWADAQFRYIPSLLEIIVRVSRRDCPAEMYKYEQISDSLELEMERLGWRLENITEPIIITQEFFDWYREAQGEEYEYD